MSIQPRQLRPIIRWAGGKRWLLPEIESLANIWNPDTFYEPFVGGGAIYLGLAWPRPTISDVNEALIAAYRGIAEAPMAVEARLATLPVSRPIYERLKKTAPLSDTEHAVRLLYLNRCGYGGIYRTDRRGNYNVPFSGDRSTDSLWKDDRIGALADTLRDTRVLAGDFETALEDVSAGAFVYCDPAYALPGPETTFRRYSPAAFAWDDQKRLAEVAHELRGRGALVVVSNSSDARVARLFRGGVTRVFNRRLRLPKARGATLEEAIYVLGQAADLQSLSGWAV